MAENKWVTGVKKNLLIRVIIPLVTGRGPPCRHPVILSENDEGVSNHLRSHETILRIPRDWKSSKIFKKQKQMTKMSLHKSLHKSLLHPFSDQHPFDLFMKYWLFKNGILLSEAL